MVISRRTFPHRISEGIWAYLLIGKNVFFDDRPGRKDLGVLVAPVGIEVFEPYARGLPRPPILSWDNEQFLSAPQKHDEVGECSWSPRRSLLAGPPLFAIADAIRSGLRA